MSILRCAAVVLSVSIAGCAADEREPAERGSLARPAIVDSCSGAPTVTNGGFETGTLDGWTKLRKAAVIPKHHTGTRGARLARTVASFGHNAVQQPVHIPATADGASSLSLWMQPRCVAAPDYAAVEVRSLAGPLIKRLMKECQSSTSWTQRSFDLSPWAGQDVVIRIDLYDDGVAETPSYLYLDDVQVLTDVSAPSVVITDPADGDNVGHVANVTAAARVSACSSLDRIDVYADGVPVGSTTSSPGTIEWNAGLAPAAHTLLARAFDTTGGTAEHSIDVTAPCGTSAVWTSVNLYGASFEPVTAATGPNGFDVTGVPQPALFLPNGAHVRALDAGSGADLLSVSNGGTIDHPSLPVEVGTGAAATTYVFSASSDGFLYRHQMVGGVMVAAGSRDLRRPACSQDQLVATPAVHGTTIFVTTHTGCGDHTRNRIFAFDAAAPMDAPPLWIFNDDAARTVDFSDGGCAVDEMLGHLYCATSSEPLTSTNTVWALDIETGVLQWAVDAGAIVNRPVLDPVTRHLIVATTPGSLRAIAPDSALNGTAPIVWTVAVASPGSILGATDIWAEHRGNLANRIFAVDSAGILYMVKDLGTTASVLWSFTPLPGEQFHSEPVVKMVGGQGLLYAGTDGGRVMQMRPTDTGVTIESVRGIDEAPGIDTSGVLLLGNAMIATSAGSSITTRRFCVPTRNEGAPY